MLRLPEDLRDRIKAAAKRNNRSMNAEITHVLLPAFPNERPPIDEARAHIGNLLHQISQMSGMFNDEDGSIAEAVDEAEQFLSSREV